MNGQALGNIDYVLNGEKLGSVKLVADKKIKKISLSNMNEKLFFSWFRLLR